MIGIEQDALRNLRREWINYLIGSLMFGLAGYLILRANWEPRFALRWLVVTIALVALQFRYLYNHLAENRLKGIANAPLFSDLGPANRFTMVRSVFTAALAGFLLSPWPQGWLAWTPSLLYLSSSLMDYVDGYIARITGRTTRLGEDLDMRWDGTGMLYGTALSVLYGQAPIPYLLVGLARYAFLFGLWVRGKRGQPVYDLPPGRFRRALAGTQMGFVAVILMPLFDPPATRLAAILFMLPLLVGFVRDYLWATGRLALPAAGQEERPSTLRARVEAFLPLALRALVFALLVYLIIHLLQQPAPNWAVIIVAGLSGLAIAAGAAGRTFALVVLLLSGFGLHSAPLEWRYWVILVFSTFLFMSGTGRYSIWKPEDWLIYRRAGERAAQH